MKKIQIFANIIFITFLLFILANLLLAIVWEIRTKIKLNYTDFKAFDKVVRKALDLNEEDSNQLYIETYKPYRFQNCYKLSTIFHPHFHRFASKENHYLPSNH